MLISVAIHIVIRMKRLFANTFMIGLVAFALTACNDEVRQDHDRDRSGDNSKQLPGMDKPSDYSKDYDTMPKNNTATPDSNRYIGSQVDTVHGQRDNQPKR